MAQGGEHVQATTSAPPWQFAQLKWLPAVLKQWTQVWLATHCVKFYFLLDTRELPGIALVNILNGWIFTGKGNTHLKWNIEVVHVEEKKFEWDNFLWNSILASAKDFSYSI